MTWSKRILWPACLAAAWTLLAPGMVLADDDAGGSCTCVEQPGASYVVFGAAAEDVSGTTQANGLRGAYPNGWYVSSRLFAAGGPYNRQRYELRLQDTGSENGRGWGRIAVWPLSVELNSSRRDDYAWDLHGLSPELPRQRTDYRSAQLRWHKGEAQNMQLRYEGRKIDRQGGTLLRDLEYRRLGYQYNFSVGGTGVRGQYCQVNTEVDAPRIGVSSGKIDTSTVRLEAPFGDKLTAYGTGSVAHFSFDNLLDSSMDTTDYTTGLRYRPSCDWEFSADYRHKENPSSNAVSSHSDGFCRLAATAVYTPGCGNRIEAGYNCQKTNYFQLHMQDPSVRSLLHGTAQVTPADVAAVTSNYLPRTHNAWAGFRWQLSDRLSADGRLDYHFGSPPLTDLVQEGSASLFPDKRLDASTDWNYEVSDKDTLGLKLNQQNSSWNDRDSSFDLLSVSGTWTRDLGGPGLMTLALSNSTSSLSAPDVTDTYASDNTSYVVTLYNEHPIVDYTLDFAYTNSTGAERYTQTAVGADIGPRCIPDLGLRVDWFDRNYKTITGLNTTALEVGVTYKLRF